MEHDDTLEEAAFDAAFAETAAEPAAQPAAPNGTASPENDDDTTAAPAQAAAAPVQSPAPAPAAASTEDTTAAPAPDPFAGLPKEVRDLLAEIPTLRTRTETAERQAKEFGGRVASLQSRLDKLGQGTAAVTAPAPQPTSNPKVQALRDQGLDEIADAIEAALPVPTQKDNPAPAPTAAAPAAPAQDESPQFKTLNKLRPSWLDEVNGSDYVLWLNRQPLAYRQRVESTRDPADILLSLQDFDKRANAAAPTPPPPQPQGSRTSRMAGAVVPQGDGKRGPRGAQPMDEEEAFNVGFNGG